MPYLSANAISSPFKIHQNLKHFSLTSRLLLWSKRLPPSFAYILFSILTPLQPTPHPAVRSIRSRDCSAHYPPMAPPSHFKPKQSNPRYYFPFCYSSSGLFPICGAGQACPHVSQLPFLQPGALQPHWFVPWSSSGHYLDVTCIMRARLFEVANPTP